MMGRYGGPMNEIELVGTRVDFRSFAADVRARRPGQLEAGTSPAPYDSFASGWRFADGDKLVITAEDGTMVVHGSQVACETLATTLDSLAESPDSTAHLHVEAYEDDPWIDAASWPLVLTLRDDSSEA